MIWWRGFCSGRFAPEAVGLTQQEPGAFLGRCLVQTPKFRRPICKKNVKSTDAEFPFCSDRCRMIDLGKWASGAYVIASPVTDAEASIEIAIPRIRKICEEYAGIRR